MNVSTIRLGSRSLWEKGTNSSFIEIPPRVITMPHVKRLALVYHDLGKWSSKYYQQDDKEECLSGENNGAFLCRGIEEEEGRNLDLLLVVVLARVAINVRRWERKKIETMEKESETGVALDTFWIGGDKMPSASMIRTQPILEHHFVP
ncbi:hypothetical protein GQ457_15G019530 [Hibiscus cannabinus]